MKDSTSGGTWVRCFKQFLNNLTPKIMIVLHKPNFFIRFIEYSQEKVKKYQEGERRKKIWKLQRRGRVLEYYHLNGGVLLSPRKYKIKSQQSFFSSFTLKYRRIEELFHLKKKKKKEAVELKN